MNLRKLKLAFQLEPSRQKVLAEWISDLNHLQSIRLRSIGEMGEPSDLHLKPLSNLKNLSSLYLLGRLKNPSIMEQLPQSLTEVTLSASQLSNDPMPKLGKLPKLRSLCLYSGSYKGITMVCSIDDFPQLLVLKLWMLDNLKSWDVQEGAMRNLRELEIRSCNILEIPTGLTRLETLQELKLTICPKTSTSKFRTNLQKLRSNIRISCSLHPSWLNIDGPYWMELQLGLHVSYAFLTTLLLIFTYVAFDSSELDNYYNLHFNSLLISAFFHHSSGYWYDTEWKPESKCVKNTSLCYDIYLAILVWSVA